MLITKIETAGMIQVIAKEDVGNTTTIERMPRTVIMDHHHQNQKVVMGEMILLPGNLPLSVINEIVPIRRLVIIMNLMTMIGNVWR